MYARVDITAETESAILAPKVYIREIGQLSMVWISSEEGLLRFFVRLGSDYGDQVEVIAGLEVGDTLVVPASSQ